MNEFESSTRIVSRTALTFTSQARYIQQRAIARRPCVVRIGEIVFFSSATGDAWMLDVAGDGAACLARDGEVQPVPVHETSTRLEIGWDTDYAIEGEAFTHRPRGEASGPTVLGYPTAAIKHLLAVQPSDSSVEFAAALVAADRLKKTGRNDPCPCGGGRKYKKCCLDRDEALVRTAAPDLKSGGIERFEVDEGDDDEWMDDGEEEGEERDEDVIDNDGDGPPVFAGDRADDADACKIPPEVNRQLDAIWIEFNSHQVPSSEQIDRFLDGLFALPPEATEWNDAFHAAVQHPDADFARCFRRISQGVPHIKATDLAFFYWAAMEQAIRRGERQLVPEIVAGFCRLDRTSYDADALTHIEDWLLAAGCEAESLILMETFVPILREDADNLMAYVLPDAAHHLFELRCGAFLRSEFTPGPPAETLRGELRRGIEGEIAASASASAAAVITGNVPAPAWKRAEFKLARGDILTSDTAWQEHLRLNAMLMHLAREAWRTESYPAGCALRGLSLACRSIYDWRQSPRRIRGKEMPWNLLDYLRPRDMEARLAEACRDVLGVNKPQARLLLDAHGLLLRAALRHGLIAAKDGASTQRELDRLAKADGR